PFTGDALQGFGAVIAKAQSGAGNQVFDGARDKHFAGTGQRRDARADMDHDPADLVAHDLAFSCMQAGADRETERLDAVRYGASTADRARGAIEGISGADDVSEQDYGQDTIGLDAVPNAGEKFFDFAKDDIRVAQPHEMIRPR